MRFTSRSSGILPSENGGAHRRFPDTRSSTEFWTSLASGKDLVTECDMRWPAGLHGTPKRFGKMLDYDLFDQAFFSVHGRQAQVGPMITEYLPLRPPVLQRSWLALNQQQQSQMWSLA